MLSEAYLLVKISEEAFLRRFWPRVQKTDACWLWTGSKNNRGYGWIGFYDKSKRENSLHLAHRLSWRLANGAIPDGLEILHSCDNTACVNPVHLRSGTHAENMAEASKRRRFALGSARRGVRLKEPQVLEIRATIGIVSGAEMARRFGVSVATVNDIRRNLYWRHLL